MEDFYGPCLTAVTSVLGSSDLSAQSWPQGRMGDSLNWAFRTAKGMTLHPGLRFLETTK